MMTAKIIFTIRSISLFLFFAFGSVKAQKYWKTYKPVSSDLIGYSANYDKSTRELQTLSKYKVSVVTKTGATSDFDEFSKNATIDLVGFENRSIKVSNIRAKGQVYIDQVNEAHLIPEDVQFIYAGLRSDSVEIEIERVTSTQIKPEELVKLLGDIGVKLDPVLKKLQVVDTLRFRSTGKATITIKNPKVYYSLQFVKLNRAGNFPEGWRLTFNPGSANAQRTMTLEPVSGKNHSRDDLLTKRHWYQKNPNPTRVWLEVDNDPNNIPQLYLKTSRDEAGYKGFLIEPNSLNNTEWLIFGQTVKTFEQYDTGLYKILKVDIEGRRTKDGKGIELLRTVLMYPEGRLKPIK